VLLDRPQVVLVWSIGDGGSTGRIQAGQKGFAPGSGGWASCPEVRRREKREVASGEGRSAELSIVVFFGGCWGTGHVICGSIRATHLFFPSLKQNTLFFPSLPQWRFLKRQDNRQETAG
jgi:hypothetical protein